MTYKIHLHSMTYLLAALLLCSCDVSKTNSAQSQQTLQASSYTELISLFDQLSYGWDTLEDGVPAFTLNAFPQDMALIYDVRLKKQLFFLSLLPMVIMQNEIILQQRETLLRLLNGSNPLVSEQSAWLSKLCRDYKCSGDPLTDHSSKEKILSRVDMVPTELVLAQAANESAYGTSRFAQQANNIFGQWTFTPGTGLVPADRPEGEYYEVRRFNTLADSIHSYLNNLNTHPAYEKLRTSRTQMRETGVPLEGKKLAEGLLNYSTRRDAYVAEIQTMIRHNRLASLAELKLRKSSRLAKQTILPTQQLSSRTAAKNVLTL
ncbi:MAG: glucosaminidase domain-containing protein [Desulfuromonas sp.]|nr:glucosaminidase domain-containing protein [Desulfuromonas sp.]